MFDAYFKHVEERKALGIPLKSFCQKGRLFTAGVHQKMPKKRDFQIYCVTPAGKKVLPQGL